MSLPLKSNVFTTALTNSSITIVEANNVRRVSVYNSSATSGTVKGNTQLGTVGSSNLTLAENETITIEAVEDDIISGLTITAPSGCTLQVVAIVK